MGLAIHPSVHTVEVGHSVELASVDVVREDYILNEAPLSSDDGSTDILNDSPWPIYEGDIEPDDIIAHQHSNDFTWMPSEEDNTDIMILPIPKKTIETSPITQPTLDKKGKTTTPNGLPNPVT